MVGQASLSTASGILQAYPSTPSEECQPPFQEGGQCKMQVPSTDPTRVPRQSCSGHGQAQGEDHITCHLDCIGPHLVKVLRWENTGLAAEKTAVGGEGGERQAGALGSEEINLREGFLGSHHLPGSSQPLALNISALRMENLTLLGWERFTN